MKQSLFFALPLALIACGGGALTGPEFTHETWQLKYITSELGVKHVPPNTARYSLQFFDDGSLEGQVDCNSLHGDYENRGSEFSIVEFAATEINCPASHAASSAVFLEALAGATQFWTENSHTLTIKGKTGATLVFEQVFELCDAPLPEPERADNRYSITADDAPSLVEELEMMRPDFVLVDSNDCSRTFTASMNHNTLTLLRCRTEIEAIE